MSSPRHRVEAVQMPKIPTQFKQRRHRPENPVPRVFDAEDIWTQAGAGGLSKQCRMKFRRIEPAAVGIRLAPLNSGQHDVLALARASQFLMAAGSHCRSYPHLLQLLEMLRLLPHTNTVGVREFRTQIPPVESTHACP